MAYDGQIHEVRTPLPSGTLSREELVTAFETSYHTQYGDTLGNRPIKVNTIRTTVIGVRPTPPLSPDATGQLTTAEPTPHTKRSVYTHDGMVTCPIYRRETLSTGATIAGPAVIEQADATTFVEPNTTAIVDRDQNLILSEA